MLTLLKANRQTAKCLIWHYWTVKIITLCLIRHWIYTNGPIYVINDSFGERKKIAILQMYMVYWVEVKPSADF